MLKTAPSCMRQASGSAKKPRPARTASATAWQEWPKMYSGLVLPSDSWCSFLTAGIFLPALGILMPSASRTGRPPAVRRAGRSADRAALVQSRVSLSRPTPGLWNMSSSGP